MRNIKSIAIGAALFTSVFGGGCGNSDDSGPLGNVDSLVILQRPKRNDMGDIFQYTSYVPTARLVKLSPPTADGTLTTLCCDKAGAEFADIDISSYDISFDAKEIVFSGKLKGSDRYGLFRLTLESGAVTQIATDPGRDYVNPIYLPGDKVMFQTNLAVNNMAMDPVANTPIDANPAQHVDEYERGTTLQMGTVGLDGTGEVLGPRNLSHRTFPTLTSDGRVMFTQWDHLGPVNAGHLMFMNTDMTELREAFGKEGTGASNSTLKAREISPGRFVGIATSRDRTIQSGALIDIRLGMPSTKNGVLRADTAMSEANASYVMLTPDVPTDREPSANTIGRYYDAFPLNAGEHPDLLVSWADGPVESSVLGSAGISANFGVYLYDTKTLQRHPILDDPEMWDIFARPLMPRSAPAVTSSSIDNSLGGQAMVGAMNVYESSLTTFQPGSIYGVRIMEGFSSEEGFPEDFGTTMFEGQANLGVARVASDGSWLATVPANVPLHLQAIDVFGMSRENEPVWFSARPGESRVCGGCHENRATTTVINPGITQAAAIGPTDAKGLVSRARRISTDAELSSPTTAPDRLVGMAWNKAIQPVFDAKCVSCHDGTPSAANPTYQIVDPTTGTMVAQFTFNLTATPVSIDYGMGEVQEWPASYLSMAGPDMEAIEMGNLMVTGTLPCKTVGGQPTLQCMEPQNSRDSYVIRLVNPTQLFPTPSTTRAFNTSPHSSVGYTELTSAEFYKLILAADMGVNYYARENNPMLNRY
ncbi:MAG TPA: hypothetical protein VFV99_30055 [Kofleriaceae bacterium]|nr:hypothetical protein [Kofleriaceae bacterium]